MLFSSVGVWNIDEEGLIILAVATVIFMELVKELYPTPSTVRCDLYPQVPTGL